MNKTLAVAAITGLGLLGTASPALAARATTSASWNPLCTAVLIESTKDISNLVYRVDGIDTKIELEDGSDLYLLPGEAIDVWVKSGNNGSGDGPGYGEHFARPASCDGGQPL